MTHHLPADKLSQNKAATYRRMHGARKAATRLPDGSVPGAPHGTTGAYSDWRCRCAECRAAWAAWVKARQAQRKALLAADPSVAAHGKASTYGNWGCRCAECTLAHTIASRERRHKR